jgi:hypothetical protein
MRKKWENIVEPDRSQMAMWRMRIACPISKTVDTHSEYVILTAFPLQQWLCERATMLNCSYIACIVLLFFLTLFLIESGMRKRNPYLCMVQSIGRRPRGVS